MKTIIGFGFLFGTDAAIGLVNAIARSAAYWQFDSLPRDIFIAALLMGGLVTFPGTWIASRLVAMMAMMLHNLLIGGLIIGGGVFLIYQASGL